MTALEGTICLSSIIAFLMLGWFLPRKLGILGVLLAHFTISILIVVAMLFDIIRGVVPDPDFVWLIGNFFWVALANIMLLPLSVFACYRHFANKRKGNTPL